MNRNYPEQSSIEKEQLTSGIAEQEVIAILRRHGSVEHLLLRLGDSLADRELRKDFFVFLRAMFIDQWMTSFNEKGHFIHPDDQGAILRPVEWEEFPHFYDVALQPRLSSDSLDLGFILRLRDRYPNVNYLELFGGVMAIYASMIATLETEAGKRIYQQYGGRPDINDQRYYEIKKSVNEELGLQQGFKEILSRINGDPYFYIDQLIEN